MSATDPRGNTSVRQDTNDENYYRLKILQLGCLLLERLLVIVTASAVQRIGRFLDGGAIVPQSGYGNIKAAAALLNMSESGMRKMLKKLPSITVHTPGSENMLRFEEIINHAKKSTVESTEGEES